MPASSEINFIPDAPDASNTIRDLIFQWVIKNGKRIVIITQAIVLLVFISRFKFDTDIRNLVTQVESNQAIVENLQGTESQYLENQEKLGLIKPVIARQVDWEKRLEDFNKKIPDELTLINVKFSPDAINLTARTPNPQAFQIFVSLLVSDPAIESVILRSSNFEPEENEYTFILNIGI